MESTTVKITDRDKIEDIIRTRFISGKVYIKTAQLNIQTQNFLFQGGVIFAFLPDSDENIKSVIFYIRDGDEVVFCHAVLIAREEDGSFVYEPLDIQLSRIPRKEERKNVSPVDKHEGGAVYISNIISDFTIHESLNLSRRRVDTIKDELLKKLTGIYGNSEIVFLNDKPKDSRMLYFSRKRRPYFIRNMKDINDAEKVNSDEDLKYYKSYIYDSGSLDVRAKIVSEISVPLLYKMMMPFGYIRTSAISEMSDEDYSAVRKFGMSASTVYTNDKHIIISSDDRIAVTDLSLSGLGIFFKEKVLIKHFKENSLIVFTVFLPDKKQATMLCEVRNISLIKNYIYRIGCEILNIEALGEVYYTEYLEGLEAK